MFNKKNATIVTLSTLASLFIATSASAALDGAYLGGQLGYGNIYQPKLGFNSVSGGDGGLAGRIFGGYQFTQFISAEMGYTKFSNTKLTYTDVMLSSTYSAPVTVKSYSVDLVAKGTLPLQNGFSLFGKLGAAYLNEYAGNVVLPNVSDSGTLSSYESHDAILPTYGLGASYDINKNLTADVSWIRIQKVGNTDLNSTDTETFGLSYHFG